MIVYFRGMIGRAYFYQKVIRISNGIRNNFKDIKPNPNKKIIF